MPLLYDYIKAMAQLNVVMPAQDKRHLRIRCRSQRCVQCAEQKLYMHLDICAVIMAGLKLL